MKTCACGCGRIPKTFYLGSRYCQGHHPIKVTQLIKQSESMKRVWKNRSKKERENHARKCQNRRFSPEGLKSISICMKSKASLAKLEGRKWGGGGWNKGIKMPEYVMRKRLKTLRKLIISGKFKPHESYNRVNSRKLMTRKGGLIFCASSWEVKRAQLHDRNDKIKYFKKDAVKINYIFRGDRHIYIPDFLITYCDGMKVLEEIKPIWKCKEEKSVAKFMYAARYCYERGYKWRVITKV